MPKIKIQRQIRWNVSSVPSPEEHKWTVLVVNDGRETSRILQKLYEQIQPIEDLREIASGSIKGTGIGYTAVQFSTPRAMHNIVNWGAIYQGQIKRDRELYDRESPDGLKSFIETDIQRTSPQ